MKRFIILLLILFVLISGVIYILSQGADFTFQVLMIGNVAILFLSFLSYYIASRTANSPNNAQFVRGVMGGTFLKFFLVIVCGVIYIVMNRENVKLTDILTLMLMYIIYTTAETVFLSRKARGAN